MRMLSSKYTTQTGALKRAAFERGVNPGEVARGDTVWLKRYWVVQDDRGRWRVAWERREAADVR